MLRTSHKLTVIAKAMQTNFLKMNLDALKQYIKYEQTSENFKLKWNRHKYKYGVETRLSFKFITNDRSSHDLVF